MRDVRPLHADTVTPYWPIAPLPEPPPAPVALPVPEKRPAPVRTPGSVDNATLERLKRGQVAIEARIDLHGLDQKQAFAALMGFVDISARMGRRAILVITGKGPYALGGGVLRRNAPSWLMASPFAGRILTITPAHARHGGDGAFYVLFRRKRG